MAYMPSGDQVSVETPEHIRIDYELAGIGSRFLAGVVDTVAQTLLVVAIAVAASLIGALQGDVGRIPIRVAIVAASAVLIAIGYFVIFEMLWDGQSLGKRMAGLRVIRTDGTPITAGDSLIRNILRLVDMLPPFYITGMVAIFFSQRCQRLGDLAAGTIVVKERVHDLPDVSLPEPQIAAPLPPIPAPEDILNILREGVGRVSAQELTTVERFIERRFELQPETRFRLAQQIAAPIRLHFPALLPTDLPAPEHFLEVLHSVWRQRPGVF
jgi:uncharacterized RDD family membrane protein YckC